MSDPKRLLDSSDQQGEAARRLLRDGLDVDPPKGAQAAVWAGLSTQLFPGGSGGAGGGSASGATKIGGAAAKATGLFKAAAIGAVSAVVALTGASAVESLSAPPEASIKTPAITEVATPAPVAEAAPAPSTLPAAGLPQDNTSAPDAPPPSERVIAEAPVAAQPARAAEDETTIAAADSPKASDESLGGAASSLGAAPVGSPEAAAAERASRLREESLLLSQARLALRQGNARGAIALLDQAWTRFPQGILVQEREALAIEALAQSGQRAAAAQRAQMFLRAFPKSPHAERVQTFVQ